MKKVLFLAAAVALTAGCETSRGSSMGYYYTDDGLPGCAFRYGYYPYYDSSGPAPTARMDIARVERVAIPRMIDRNGPGGFSGWTSPPPAGSGELSAAAIADRSAILPPAPAPAAPRVVGPRS
jgi:hypothetical protein